MFGMIVLMGHLSIQEVHVVLLMILTPARASYARQISLPASMEYVIPSSNFFSFFILFYSEKQKLYIIQ